MFKLFDTLASYWLRLRKGDGYDYFTISDLVRDPKTDEEVHLFLLGGLGGPKKTSIPVQNGKGQPEEYELGIISVDPAPLIPRHKANGRGNR